MSCLIFPFFSLSHFPLNTNKCRRNPFPDAMVLDHRSDVTRVIYSRIDAIAKIANQDRRDGRTKKGGEDHRYRSIAKHGGTARDEPIGVRLKYKMGFEDSDGVTRRFNYCRPGATYNFCHRPIAAFHLSSPRARSSATPPSPPLDFSALPATVARFFPASTDFFPPFCQSRKTAQKCDTVLPSPD